MGKRFSRLEYALRAIQDPTSDGARNEPPTDSILDKYQEFQSGSAGISYPRDEDSLQGSIEKVGVRPFALPLAAGNLISVPISNRALTETQVSTVRTAANIETNNELAVLDLRTYKPARAIVFIEDATQPTQKIPSKITGVPYLPTKGSSYTIPYGKDTGEEYENEIRTQITAAVAGISRASVQFKSEKF